MIHFYYSFMIIYNISKKQKKILKIMKFIIIKIVKMSKELTAITGQSSNFTKIIKLNI